MPHRDHPHGPWWRLAALIALVAVLSGAVACWDAVGELRRTYLGPGLRR